MGVVREKRAEKLLEDALLEYLKDGQIPTPGQLEYEYSQKSEELVDLTRSMIRLVDLPERWSESSAAAFNEFIEAFESDIDVLLRSMLAVTELSVTALGEWNVRAKNLQSRISKLKGRVDSLLLMKSRAAGYLAFLEDGFLSLEHVSSDTTAEIDTRTGEATLLIDRTKASGAVKGTQVDLQSAHVTWSMIEGGNTKYISRITGTALRNVLTDNTSTWRAEAVSKAPRTFRTASKSGKPIVGEMKVQLPQETELSRIVLIMADAAAGSSDVVSAQYSTDGYTWANVQDETPALSGRGDFTWRFPKTMMKFFKIIISKSSPDETRQTGSVYDYGVQQVKVYSEVYDISAGGVQLVTELLYPAIAGSAAPFGRASFEVCEEVPEGTSINYSLRAHDGTDYTDWVGVLPMNRKSTAPAAAVVDFAAPEEKDSDDLATVFDSSLDGGALNILRQDGGSSLSYRFPDADTTVANFYIPHDESILSDLTLMRNAGYTDGKFPSVDADLMVGDVECGWGLEGGAIYYCDFYIKNPSGLVLDFGGTQAFIDNRVVSGSVSIPPGWHSFRTDRSNWAALTGTSPTTQDELSALDPLYPFNHKYMIEGYNYPASFESDEGVYLGAEYYCQTRATRVGRHIFLADPFDPATFALDTLDGPKTIVLMKFDSSRPNHENERVRLLYTRRYESFTGIQMKAVLESKDSERTPVLSYYRIMVK